jgi:D-aminopeptidase
MAGSRAQVAVKVRSCLWAVGRAGCRMGVPSLAAGGEAQAADELSQQLRSVIMAALHETAEPVAAKSMRAVFIINCVIASTRPAVAEGREGAQPHADPAGILERLVVSEERGDIRDCIEPHAPGPGEDAVK